MYSAKVLSVPICGVNKGENFYHFKSSSFEELGIRAFDKGKG